MFISQINCKTQGLRKAFINSMTNDRHYNIKTLKKLDKNLAKTYTNTKYYGGSLKSFWNKVKRFGKNVLNAPAKIMSKIYPWMKKGIDKLDASTVAKNLLEKVPIVGPAIPAAIHGLKEITDNVDVLIKEIKEKNPGASIQQIKEIVRKIMNTFNEVKEKVPEEDRKIIKDNVDKVLRKLPDVIKKEGVAKVDKAAGYLPYLDKSSMKIEERTGKGGRILAPKIRFIKPNIINKYKDVFAKLPAYDAKLIGEVGGAIYYKLPKAKDLKENQTLADKSKDFFEKTKKIKTNSGRIDMGGEITTPAKNVSSGRVKVPEVPKECGRVAMSGRTKLAGEDERAAILARLRGKK